jgi:hypothetical protein
LLRGQGLSDAQPRERQFHSGHRGAEPVGGVRGGLGDGIVVGLGCGSARGVLAGVLGCGGCCGHWVRGISLESVLKARPRRLVAAQAWKSPWLVTVLKGYDGRSAIEVSVEPSPIISRNQGAEIPDEWRASNGLKGMPRGIPHR